MRTENFAKFAENCAKILAQLYVYIDLFVSRGAPVHHR